MEMRIKKTHSNSYKKELVIDLWAAGRAGGLALPYNLKWAIRRGQ